MQSSQWTPIAAPLRVQLTTHNSKAMNYRTVDTILIGVSVIAVLFLILNFADLSNQAQSGLSYSAAADYKVTRVEPGSPADEAGFEVGDRVRMNGGIEVTNSKAFTERARPAVGDVREYVIERDGEQMTKSLTFGPVLQRTRLFSYLNYITAFCFLICGIWPYLKKRNPQSALFALTGATFFLLLIGPPYFASFSLRTAISYIFFPIAFSSLAFLVHFALSYPERNSWLDKKMAMPMIYGPVVFLTLYSAILAIARPDTTSAFARINQLISAVIIGGFLVAAVYLLIRMYLKADAEKRSAFGLNIMLIGILIALLPTIASIVMNAVSPGTIFPAFDFLAYTLILLPIAFAYAIVKAPLPAEEAVGIAAEA